ncbi:hypothetical protein LTR85_008473 [Meristemomyces frigidus]|nr:hypothetical protein LTR85_008473 [Meristemomyces frigidus]
MASNLTIPGNIIISGNTKATQLQAAARVLNTAELLEAVFLQLPIKALLRLESTCKGFKRGMEASIQIRRHMYRAPDSSCIPRQSAFPKPRGIRFPYMDDHNVHRNQRSLWLYLRHHLMIASLWQSPSFRRMHIAQPPVKRIELDGRCDLEFDETGSVGDAVITDESGVTFGDLFDAIEVCEGKGCTVHGDECGTDTRYVIHGTWDSDSSSDSGSSVPLRQRERREREQQRQR